MNLYPRSLRTASGSVLRQPIAMQHMNRVHVSFCFRWVAAIGSSSAYCSRAHVVLSSHMCEARYSGTCAYITYIHVYIVAYMSRSFNFIEWYTVIVDIRTVNTIARGRSGWNYHVLIEHRTQNISMSVAITCALCGVYYQSQEYSFSSSSSSS